MVQLASQSTLRSSSRRIARSSASKSLMSADRVITHLETCHHIEIKEKNWEGPINPSREHWPRLRKSQALDPMLPKQKMGPIKGPIVVEICLGGLDRSS